jgi:hypothetical protein
MQTVIETKINYQGITRDESLALRQLFDTKTDDPEAKVQFSDLLLLQGLTK